MFRTFAIAALVASVSSVQLHSQVKTKSQWGEPPSWEDVLAVLDKNGDQEVSWGEIEAFIKQIEEEHGVKIPKEDRDEIKKIFKMVDTDNSGKIDKAEFEAAMEDAGALGQRSKKTFSKLAQMKSKQPPSWQEILDVLDEDKNGKVSWEEVEGFMDKIEEEHGVVISKEDRADVKKVFDMVDADGSGEIDKEEFEASLADAGALGQRSKMTFTKLAQMKSKQEGAPTWEDVLAVLDKDGNGRISWGEVLQFIKRIEEEHNVKISKEDKKAIKAGFDAVDTDGSGEVDKAEFEAAVAAEEGLAVLKKWM